MTSKFDHQHRRESARAAVLSTSPFRALLAAQAGGPDEHQPLDPVAVLDGELRRQQAAERKADQPEFVDAEHVEEIEIMHHVIVHARSSPDRRRIRQIPDGIGMMTRNFSAQGRANSNAVPGSGAVQEHQRFALSGGEHARLDAVDGESLAFEAGQRDSSGALEILPVLLRLRGGDAAVRARRARMRGITSCANRFRFFTTFQCGMLPIAPRMLKWLVPICSPHCVELLDHLIGGADCDEERFVDRPRN